MENFNTSHVNVNQWHLAQNHIHILYFNTSHVNVNRVQSTIIDVRFHISIHLMLMLITLIELLHLIIQDFNTSHVNVNPISNDGFVSERELFQYISC